jgi:hypothetical protein
MSEMGTMGKLIVDIQQLVVRNHRRFFVIYWTFANISPLHLGEEPGVRVWVNHTRKARRFMPKSPHPNPLPLGDGTLIFLFEKDQSFIQFAVLSFLVSSSFVS